MKISIAVAVYNEEKNILNLLDSVGGLDYPREDFELVLVNDGSTDNTGASVSAWAAAHPEIAVFYKKLSVNRGRMLARKEAAESAHFPNLLITDARCVLPKDTLQIAKDISYQPVVGNPITTQKGPIGRLFYLLRFKIYPGSFGESFDDVFIDQSNFDAVGKGTTILLIDRHLFLESLPDNETRHASDDTKILFTVCQKKKILKTARLKCIYNQREGLSEEIRHTFERGPKFVDYYYHFGKKYFAWINISLILSALLVVLVVSGYLASLLWLAILADLIVSVYLAKSLRDVGVVFIFLPVISATFWCGILYGLFLKLRRVF